MERETERKRVSGGGRGEGGRGKLISTLIDRWREGDGRERDELSP